MSAVGGSSGEEIIQLVKKRSVGKSMKATINQQARAI
jgi:hypothetical protein